MSAPRGHDRGLTRNRSVGAPLRILVGVNSEATVARPRLRLPQPLLALSSDERLVRELRAGSERAFEVLFDRYSRPLVAFCRQLVGPAEAEDAVQHTFLAAYRGLVTSQKSIVVRPWLYTIARHRCLSILRVRAEHLPVDGLESAADDLVAAVAVGDDLRALLGDLGRLPEQQRTALVLMELGDLSHAEIAAVIGCPLPKVKALVYQARSSLVASRQARETPCQAIRLQLAAPDGDGVSRALVRRHLKTCGACRTFGDDVRVQRHGLALLLPVLPSPGLKASVLGAVLGGGTGGGGAAVTAGALLGGDLAAKALLAAAVVGGGVAGTTATATSDDSRPTSATTAHKPVTLASPLRVTLAAAPSGDAPLAAHAGAATTGTAFEQRQLGRTTGRRRAGERHAGATPGSGDAVTSADEPRRRPGATQPPGTPSALDEADSAVEPAKADKSSKGDSRTAKSEKAPKPAKPEPSTAKSEKAPKPAKPEPSTAKSEKAPKPAKPEPSTAKSEKSPKPAKPEPSTAKSEKSPSPTTPRRSRTAACPRARPGSARRPSHRHRHVSLRSGQLGAGQASPCGRPLGVHEPAQLGRAPRRRVSTGNGGDPGSAGSVEATGVTAQSKPDKGDRKAGSVGGDPSAGTAGTPEPEN